MNIAIFGLGLIGGSIAKRLAKVGGYNIFGQDINQNVVQKSLDMGIICQQLNEKNIDKMDIVILAVCQNDAIKIIKEIVGSLKKGCIVADCCGNKTKIVNCMMDMASENVEFVGMHPMAGREFSGLMHATVNLFEHSSTILVPINLSEQSFGVINKLLKDLGSTNIVVTNAQNHDKMISYTSQLAHIVSSAYIKNPLSSIHFGYSAGSFKDMTRVAKLNSDMWTELFLDNRDNLIMQIDILQNEIEKYKVALANNDADALKKLLVEGNEKKAKAERHIDKE